MTPISATIAPELIIHSDYGDLFFSNPAVLFPIFSILVLIVVLVTLAIHQFRKKWQQGQIIKQL